MLEPHLASRLQSTCSRDQRAWRNSSRVQALGAYRASKVCLSFSDIGNNAKEEISVQGQDLRLRSRFVEQIDVVDVSLPGCVVCENGQCALTDRAGLV